MTALMLLGLAAGPALAAPPDDLARLAWLEGRWEGTKRVVFENRQHDFPQRILYWLDPGGALHARIEGPQGGKTVSEEWVWTRAR